MNLIATVLITLSQAGAGMPLQDAHPTVTKAPATKQAAAKPASAGQGTTKKGPQEAKPAKAVGAPDKKGVSEPGDEAAVFSKTQDEAEAAKGGPLRTDAVIQKLTRMDRDGDGFVSYLEARDLGSIDLVTFRRIDTDGSGGLDLLEFETHMVQTYESNGLPVERSLGLRVKAHVEELMKLREEEQARKRPTYLLEKTLEAMMDQSQMASRRPVATTRLYHQLLPEGPRPRSPYHPRYHGF